MHIRPGEFFWEEAFACTLTYNYKIKKNYRCNVMSSSFSCLLWPCHPSTILLMQCTVGYVEIFEGLILSNYLDEMNIGKPLLLLCLQFEHFSEKKNNLPGLLNIQ